MDKRYIKNLEIAKTFDFAGAIDYQPGKVVSSTFVQNEAVSITLFAFAGGEGISTHAASGDALVYILDGTADITIGEETVTASKGQAVVMPANVPHGLEAVDNFKMLLIVAKK
ncbi:MAG TPA: cupin domain-containing protein [Patescibacteria group bacterium]|nr:cupin domain-containing protein [Patescibacteria group bacterium]